MVAIELHGWKFSGQGRWILAPWQQRAAALVSDVLVDIYIF
jgi:hypothetical protein